MLKGTQIKRYFASVLRDYSPSLSQKFSEKQSSQFKAASGPCHARTVCTAPLLAFQPEIAEEERPM
jgi:hypothetical protein